MPTRTTKKKPLHKKGKSPKTAAKTRVKKTKFSKTKVKSKAKTKVKKKRKASKRDQVKRSRSKTAKGKPDKKPGTLEVAEVALSASPPREVQVYDDPPKPRRRRTIHKRRKAPPVKKGKVVKDAGPTPPADIKKR